MTGCTDKDYDLSDIDTTTRINVNDLVIPVNIDPVRMGDILKFDDESKIQPITVNGQEIYALIQSGDINSSAIDIKPVYGKAEPINPTHDIITIETPAGTRPKAPSTTVHGVIREVGEDFSYSANNIDPAIESVEYITTKPFRFTMHIGLNLEGITISKVEYDHVKIRAPKGLTCKPTTGTYDPETGIWIIPDLIVNGSWTDVSLEATGINTVLADAPIKNHSIDFSGEFRIEEAFAEITAEMTTIPTQADITLNYEIGDFEATAFTGSVHYDIDGIDIPSISLSGIPDQMKGDHSNIILANPQIFINLNNPVAYAGVDFKSGMCLTSQHFGYPDLEFRPSKDIVVTDKYGDGPYNFVLAPEFDKADVPTEPIDFSKNLEFVEFDGLSNVLTTPADFPVKGMPEAIDVVLENPRIASDKVTDFRLEPIDGVTGHYYVMAPLALKSVTDGEKPFIYYTDRRDGWNEDGDLDDLAVTTLELNANATNNCPVDIELTIYPLTRDAHGNVTRIVNKDESGDNSGNYAVIKSNTIQAGKSEPLTISLNGMITNLDGIDIEAKMIGGTSQDALGPNQTLDLTDIKAKVTGYYQTDF